MVHDSYIPVELIHKEDYIIAYFDMESIIAPKNISSARLIFESDNEELLKCKKPKTSLGVEDLPDASKSLEEPIFVSNYEYKMHVDITEEFRYLQTHGVENRGVQVRGLSAEGLHVRLQVRRGELSR